VLDVHALRHTFGTLLSKGGVAPRTAQAAMRHSKIDLTMTVYTDPALLDVRGALDALPDLALDSAREAEWATGTAGDFRQGVCSLAPTLAPTPDKSVQAGAFPVISAAAPRQGEERGPLAVSGSPGKRKHPLTSPVSGCQGVGATGLEPVTPSVSKCSDTPVPIACFPVNSRHFLRLYPGNRALQVMADNSEELQGIAG
jgi:hypothetical protein